MQRYPTLVRDLVRHNRFLFANIKDDLEAALMLWMVQRRVVEKYDESKRANVSNDKGREKLFLSYVYFCLRRAQQTIMQGWKGDAMYYKTEPEHEQEEHPALLTVAVTPDQIPSIMLDDFQAKLDAEYPGYSQLLRLLRMGYTLQEISRASGLKGGTLLAVVTKVFPTIQRGERVSRSQTYKRLLTLGEFSATTYQRKAQRIRVPPVLCVCVQCGADFTVDGVVYKYRMKVKRDGKLCCSRSCGAKLRKVKY